MNKPMRTILGEEAGIRPVWALQTGVRHVSRINMTQEAGRMFKITDLKSENFRTGRSRKAERHILDQLLSRQGIIRAEDGDSEVIKRMGMLIIAERINASRKTIARAIETGDRSFIQNEAKTQTEAGAHYIDVNAGTFVGEEAKKLEWIVEAVQEVPDLPLSIDSPTRR